MNLLNKTLPVKAVLLATSLLAGHAAAPFAVAGEQSATQSVDVTESKADVAFKELLNELTESYFAITPELATFFGVRAEMAGLKNAIDLSDYSPAGVVKSKEATQEILNRLVSFDSKGLSESNRLNLAILKTELTNAVEASEVVEYGRLSPGMFRVYQLDQFIGAHSFVLSLLASAQPVGSEQEALDYLARLKRIPEAFEDLMISMDADAQRGVVPPDFVLNKIIASIETAIEPAVEDNPLVTSFAEKVQAAEVADAEALKAQVIEVVATVVYPAYKKLVADLTDMLPKSVHEAGIWRLPNGDKLYQALILQQANTDLSADEIHDLGLADVDRISAEMDTILKQVNYTEGTVAERMLALSEDKRFIYPNTDEGKAAIIAVLNEQMAEITKELPKWFGVLPQDDGVVKKVPSYEEATSASASYDPAAMDGSRPGVYWINLRDTAMVPIWSAKSDTYHETIPGHHLQISIAQHQAEVPLIRNLLGNGAYIEGWALYGEFLAKEMGMYDTDPYGDLGRLRWELHRAVRLVVDTGIHAKHWSREDAIAYSMKVGGFDAATAEQEVERYAVLPGQALSYKMGMLKILELRDKAKAKLGDDFDIRLFHDAVLLGGSMPLMMLDDTINAWIDSQAAH